MQRRATKNVIFTVELKRRERGRVAVGVRMKKGRRGSGGTEGRRKYLLINVGFEAPLLLGSPARWR